MNYSRGGWLPLAPFIYRLKNRRIKMHSLPLIAAIDSAATTGFASLVSSVGFPIVAFGLVAWYIKYQDDKHREQIESIEESHREVEKSMTDALNANTQVLQRLLGVLDRSSK